MNGRGLVQLAYQTAPVYLTFREEAKVSDLNAGIARLMTEQGLGDQWQTDREPEEVIDFNYCYPIIEIPQISDVDIFIKQKKYRIKVTDSWVNVSDRLLAEYGMPRGTQFRLFPVDMEIDRLGEDDHAFSFDLVEGKQYWFEIVHDLAKDPHGLFSQEIRMIDPMDRVDRMVIPLNAEIRDIGTLWRRILDMPDSIEL
jgi:hypothetical protein